MPQPDTFLDADFVMHWHAWTPAIGLILLALVLLYAVLQYAVAGSGGPAARFLNGGSLRAGMGVGLVLAGTVPAAALGLILSERSASQRQERMATILEETTASVARMVDGFMDKHRSGMATAASSISAAGRFDRASLTQALMIYHDAYPDFLTMLSANQQGDIVTATSNMTGFLTSVDALAGHNVADRPYFLAPMRSGLPFISKVFQGRDLGSDPIVAISAPLRDFEGGIFGIVEGSLDLRAFSRIDNARPRLDGAVLLLVDQDDRVIYSTASAGLQALQPIGSDPLITAANHGADGRSYLFAASVDGLRGQYLGAHAATRLGWRVYMRMPMSGISQQMSADYRVGALLLVVAVVLSLLLAGGIVRRVSRSVGDMNKAVQGFSIDGAGEQIRTPSNTAREFQPIFAQMRKRSRHLRKAYARLRTSIEAGEKLRRELTQAVTLKEVEIAERTAELEEANARLSGLTKIDPLTGLANRREFDAFERRAWRLGAREQRTIAVILIDIDYFKIYNDTLGHQAGDDCLRRVAAALSGCAGRPLDLVARYGGEEFVAVLGDTGVEDALVVAQRMRLAVVELGIPHPGSSHQVVSVSIGVAAALPAADSDGRKLVKAADEALYYAKAAGRNCVVSRRADEFVVHSAAEKNTATTGVLAILAGERA